MSFDDPWVLVLLPLAAWPLWSASGAALVNGWMAYAPKDAASRAVGWALRVAASLALAALVAAMAGPHLPEYTVKRVGQGAEIVLVLDRSRSMDQGFAPGGRAPPPGGNTQQTLDYYFSQSPARLRESKGKVARRLLADFTAKRPDDSFALVVFSTLPMRVLDFTQRQDALQAAIAAGDIGRGLSETNIGLALDAALAMFDARPYTGSRIVLLVSDGGDRVDPESRERLARTLRKERVSLYWIYLRSANSPGLKAGADDSPDAINSVPELMLNRFFESLQTPYHPYEASDAQALERAIEDVNRQEKLPVVYDDLVPRRELAPWLDGLALACVLMLLAARLAQVRQWA